MYFTPTRLSLAAFSLLGTDFLIEAFEHEVFGLWWLFDMTLGVANIFLFMMAWKRLRAQQGLATIQVAEKFTVQVGAREVQMRPVMRGQSVGFEVTSEDGVMGTMFLNPPQFLEALTVETDGGEDGE